MTVFDRPIISKPKPVSLSPTLPTSISTSPQSGCPVSTYTYVAYCRVVTQNDLSMDIITSNLIHALSHFLNLSLIMNVASDISYKIHIYRSLLADASSIKSSKPNVVDPLPLDANIVPIASNNDVNSFSAYPFRLCYLDLLINAFIMTKSSKLRLLQKNVKSIKI